MPLVITDESSREDLAICLGHLAHKASRTVNLKDLAAIHHDIDECLTAWEARGALEVPC